MTLITIKDRGHAGCGNRPQVEKELGGYLLRRRFILPGAVLDTALTFIFIVIRHPYKTGGVVVRVQDQRAPCVHLNAFTPLSVDRQTLSAG